MTSRAKRYREKEERMVLAKLHVEGLKLSSDWPLIEKCLSQTVAPQRCILAAQRMRQNLKAKKKGTKQ